MIKRVFVCFVTLVLIICIPLSVYATSSFDYTGSAHVLHMAQLPDMPNSFYWVLGDGNGDQTGYNTFLFICTFPYLSRDQFTSSEITVNLHLQSDRQVLDIIAPTLPNVPFYIHIYRGTGTLLDQRLQYLDSNGSYNYSFLTWGDKHFYYAAGNYTILNESSYIPLNLMWSDTYAETNDLYQIFQKLVNIQVSTAISADADQVIRTQLTAFLGFYTNWINGYCSQALSNIQVDLDAIAAALGAGSTAPDYETNSEAASEIDEYVSREGVIMDQFNAIDVPLDNAISNVSTYMSSFRAPLIFIRDIFNEFIPDGSVPWIIIFFSLVFGIIATLIGKRIKSS